MNFMSEKIKNILIHFAYFVFAVAIFGSMGVWLPIAIDWYNLSQITEATNKSLPSNILTYSLGIFLVAAIDRIIHLLFKTGKYSSNVLEFFGILMALLVTAILVYFSLRCLRNTLIEDAMLYAMYIAFIAWFAWFYVKLQGAKADNYSPIGGRI